MAPPDLCRTGQNFTPDSVKVIVTAQIELKVWEKACATPTKITFLDVVDAAVNAGDEKSSSLVKELTAEKQGLIVGTVRIQQVVGNATQNLGIRGWWESRRWMLSSLHRRVSGRSEGADIEISPAECA